MHSERIHCLTRTAGIFLAASAVFLSSPPNSAEGRITRIIITSKESPTFGGVSFGQVGAYEKLQGKAFGEIDPRDRLNALITDIALASRNAAGMVEYSMDICILKPVDTS